MLFITAGASPFKVMCLNCCSRSIFTLKSLVFANTSFTCPFSFTENSTVMVCECGVFCNADGALMSCFTCLLKCWLLFSLCASPLVNENRKGMMKSKNTKLISWRLVFKYA